MNMTHRFLIPTAAALAWGAHLIAQRGARDDVMISVHADWAIGDAEGFRAALLAAAETAAREHALVTVGIVPVRPDPGFGYIQPGEPAGPVARASTPAPRAARAPRPPRG